MSAADALIHLHDGDRFPEGLGSPDVYFLPEYGGAASLSELGDWVLLEAYDGAWQMPLIVRTLPDGAKDAISPYGYTGAYASPSLSSQQIQRAWVATVNIPRKLGVISALLRHSPLVPQAPDLPELLPILREHPTILLEPADSDSTWGAMESRCRNQVRKAQKNGYTGKVRPVTAVDLASNSDFRRLYEGTMRHRAATGQYFFGDDYYRALLDGLGANLLMAETRDPAGRTVSSTLLMRHEQRLHYHLTGSNPDGARMGSNNLMLWTASDFAATHGIAQFHLGGGLRAGDDLFRLKRKFGGRELEYRVSGLIVEKEIYRARTEQRARECNVTAEELCATHYFPAYRREFKQEPPDEHRDPRTAGEGTSSGGVGNDQGLCA
jgi:hypothetical protein